MKGVRPTTKCKRSMGGGVRCRRTLAEHGPNGECPGDPTKTFHVQVQSARAASASFSPDELDALDNVLKTMLRGGQPIAAGKSAELAGVLRKTEAMKKSIAERKNRDATLVRAAPGRRVVVNNLKGEFVGAVDVPKEAACTDR